MPERGTHVNVVRTMEREVEDLGQKQIYEVGFHLNPALSEEKLSGEVTGLRSAIERSGGVIIAEEFPQPRPLSHIIIKAIGRERRRFASVFFGWMKFEAERTAAAALKEYLDKSENFLRYLIVKTVRESTMGSHRAVFARGRPAGRRDESADKTPRPKMSEEEIDKTIEKLVIE